MDDIANFEIPRHIRYRGDQPIKVNPRLGLSPCSKANQQEHQKCNELGSFSSQFTNLPLVRRDSWVSVVRTDPSSPSILKSAPALCARGTGIPRIRGSRPYPFSRRNRSQCASVGRDCATV